MEKKKKAPNPIRNIETLERVNFLSEASIFASKNPDLVDLAQYLGSEADMTSKRCNIRKKPKRLFCKKCFCPLTSEFTAEIDINPKFLTYICRLCGEKKRVFNGEKPKNNPNVHDIKYVTLNSK